MKIFKTLIVIVVIGLLSSVQAIACDVYITVHNGLADQMDGLQVHGPFGRYSDVHDLKSGESFTYHATGSALSCHGDYTMESGKNNLTKANYCIIDKFTVNINMSKDGRAYMDIVGKSGDECIVETIKPSNSLNDSLNCVALYSQDNICDYDHWSEIYDRCETYSYPAMEKDNFLLNQIRDGKCSYDNWSNLYNQITARE